MNTQGWSFSLLQPASVSACLPTSPPLPRCCSGTLRDQLLYPEPPQSVMAAAGPASRSRVLPWMKSRSMGKEELEERLSGEL